MDIREKLVELIRIRYRESSVNDPIDYRIPKEIAEKIADHLIANGVMVQEWIPVTEQLPTKEDANRFDEVLAVMKYCESTVYPYYMLVNNPENFLCWMSLPMSPKGEEK